MKPLKTSSQNEKCVENQTGKISRTNLSLLKNGLTWDREKWQDFFDKRQNSVLIKHKAKIA